MKDAWEFLALVLALLPSAASAPISGRRPV